MPTYLNTYKLPEPAPVPYECHLHTPLEQYDFNFVFDVKPCRSDKVELRPFVPSLHAKPMLESSLKYPEVFKYLGLGSGFKTLDEVCRWAETSARRDIASLRYAIYTAPLDNLAAPVEDYVFAGTITLLESNYINMISEIGWIIIFPPFQRTHVATHACGLGIHRILDGPEDGGLGLRRCHWKANSLNTPSHNAALRLGFHEEGVLRAMVVLAPGSPAADEGRPGVRNADRPQRDSWYSSITWREWETSVRSHVDALMARKS